MTVIILICAKSKGLTFFFNIVFLGSVVAKTLYHTGFVGVWLLTAVIK